MNKSLSIIIAAAIGIASLPGCNNMGCVNGSGHQVSQTRSFDEFNKVSAEGGMKLVVTQNPSQQQVRIVADDNVQRRIKSRVRNGVLELDMKGSFCSPGNITVYITTKKLDGLRLSGAVEATGTNKFTTGNFLLDLSGASKVNLDLTAADVRTEASGACEVILKGQASSHQIEVSGAGELKAPDFVVGNYNIRTSGASEMTINVLNELKVKASGASEIAYKGSPKNVVSNTSGASQVKKI